MKAYKFLKSGATGAVSGFRWPLPEGSVPGAWVEAQGTLALCERGVHVCRVEDLPYWLDEELWEVEIDGETLDGVDCVVARRGRLVRRIGEWSRESQTAFLRASTAHASAAIDEAPPDRRTQAEALMGYMPNYLRLHLVALGAVCAGFAVASLAPEREQPAAYRAERAWQARCLAEQLALDP